MDELQSIGVGLALGLLLVSFLSFYPGDPFDYTADSASSSAVTPVDTKLQQVAGIKQAAQHVKIQKLQELLGLEKAKVDELVQRAKERAMYADKTDSVSSSCLGLVAGLQHQHRLSCSSLAPTGSRSCSAGSRSLLWSSKPG